MNDRARRAAERIWAAWTSGERIGGLAADVRPRDAAEGFAAQQALCEHAGPSYGWKIAATSAAGQHHIGVDGPLPGRLFTRFRREPGDRLPIRGNHMRVVEAEFAFVLGRPASDAACVLDAVESMHLAIEVQDSRLTDFERVGAAQLLADDSCAGYFVLGPAVPEWWELDLPASPTVLRINGEPVATGAGANVLGDPREALAWLAGELARFGESLRAGDVVTTGTTTTPPTVEPGDYAVAEFGKLGTVRLRF
jgi:2-keto-4-pentenoate hydratase